jgi:hypothetical protein
MSTDSKMLRAITGSMTRSDLRRLRCLVNSRLLSHHGERPALYTLNDRLDMSIVVPPQGVPPRVVTMYSCVRALELDSRRHEIHTRQRTGSRSSHRQVHRSWAGGQVME